MASTSHLIRGFGRPRSRVLRFVRFLKNIFLNDLGYVLGGAFWASTGF